MSTTDEQNENPAPSGAPADNATNSTTAAPSGAPAPKTDDNGKPDPYAALRGKDLPAAEVESLIEKLVAANGEAAAHRHKLREFEQANETETQAKIREAKETGISEAAKKYEPVILRLTAKEALVAAGAKTGHDSLIRLFDPTKIVVNDDGTVTGLDKEIARVKGEFPALFEAAPETPPRRTAPGSRMDGGKKAEPGERKKTSAELHAERVLGR